MTETNIEAAKKAAGETVAGLVKNDMRLGLGTGSTAACAIEALGRRIKEEGLRVVGVPTSFDAEMLARQHGIPLTTLFEVDRLDFAFDGADEVDPHLTLIKGRGAAHTREKIVESLADRFAVLIDSSKWVEHLGHRMPLPIEVVPMALAPVQRILEKLGARPELRKALRKDGPIVTDQGLWIVDAYFEGIPDPRALDRILNDVPGILNHGLFIGMATEAIIGREDGTVEFKYPIASS